MAASETVVLDGTALRCRGNSESGGRAAPLATYDDGDLMALVAEANEGALGELYDRFGADGYRLAWRVLCQRELAEDAVQEAFLAIWRCAEKFDSRRGTTRNWILTLVHRRAVDLVRRNQRYSPHDEQHLPTPLAPSAAEATELAAERRNVQTALGALSDHHRTVLELAYYGGLTQQEIAARLAIPVGTVKSQTYHALSQLRHLLDPTQMRPV